MAVGVFSVPVFLVVFRETLEAVIVISILLAFLKQTLGGPDGNKKVYNSLVRQVYIHQQSTFSPKLLTNIFVVGLDRCNSGFSALFGHRQCCYWYLLPRWQEYLE
jgi:high-affinity iron transporter